MPRARVWLAFVLLGLAWGSSYLFIRIGIRQLTPVALVTLRLAFGTIGLGLINALRRPDLKITKAQLATVAIIANFNIVVPFLLITWGEETVPSGLASVLNSTVPIFTVLIAGVALHDEPISLPRLAGVGVGFVGVIVLMSRDLAQGGIHWSGVAGQGAIVLASVCYASMAVVTRRRLRNVMPLVIASYAVWIATVEMTVVSLIFSRPPLEHLHPSSLFAVAWLGLLGTAFAYLLSYFILQSWGASRYTLMAYTLPIVGLTLGAVFLAEKLDWRILAGSALVVLGIVLANITRTPARFSDAAAREAVASPSLPAPGTGE